MIVVALAAAIALESGIDPDRCAAIGALLARMESSAKPAEAARVMLLDGRTRRYVSQAIHLRAVGVTSAELAMVCKP